MWAYSVEHIEWPKSFLANYFYTKGQLCVNKNSTRIQTTDKTVAKGSSKTKCRMVYVKIPETLIKGSSFEQEPQHEYD